MNTVFVVTAAVDYEGETVLGVVSNMRAVYDVIMQYEISRGADWYIAHETTVLERVDGPIKFQKEHTFYTNKEGNRIQVHKSDRN